MISRKPTLYKTHLLALNGAVSTLLRSQTFVHMRLDACVHAEQRSRRKSTGANAITGDKAAEKIAEGNVAPVRQLVNLLGRASKPCKMTERDYSRNRQGEVDKQLQMLCSRKLAIAGDYLQKTTAPGQSMGSKYITGDAFSLKSTWRPVPMASSLFGLNLMNTVKPIENPDSAADNKRWAGLTEAPERDMPGSKMDMTQKLVRLLKLGHDDSKCNTESAVRARNVQQQRLRSESKQPEQADVSPQWFNAVAPAASSRETAAGSGAAAGGRRRKHTTTKAVAVKQIEPNAGGTCDVPGKDEELLFAASVADNQRKRSTELYTKYKNQATADLNVSQMIREQRERKLKTKDQASSLQLPVKAF